MMTSGIPTISNTHPDARLSRKHNITIIKHPNKTAKPRLVWERQTTQNHESRSNTKETRT